MKNLKKLALIGALATASVNATAAPDANFDAILNLLEPIDVTLAKPLTFASMLTNADQTVITTPESPNAAIFTATGAVGWQTQAEVVENSIVLTKSGTAGGVTNEITVDTFTYGGNLDSSGLGAFSGSGSLTDMRIGASAHIKAENGSGLYIGSGTLRVTYI